MNKNTEEIGKHRHIFDPHPYAHYDVCRFCGKFKYSRNQKKGGKND